MNRSTRLSEDVDVAVDVELLFDMSSALMKGSEEDKKKGVKYLTKAAKLGHPKAQFSLGFRYETGRDGEVDLKQALHWYGQAAKQGHAGAQVNLGAFYQKGWGAEKDFEKSFEWFSKSAYQ
eukprot:g63556.t1